MSYAITSTHNEFRVVARTDDDDMIPSSPTTNLEEVIEMFHALTKALPPDRVQMQGRTVGEWQTIDVGDQQ